MTAEEKTLIAQWMSAWANDDSATQERLDARLKSTGLWAYEAGSGLPTVGHWYNGPIEPGMRFLWNPEVSDQRVRVTRVTTGGDEPMVWCVDSAGGPEVYNEESYFRSMVVPENAVQQRSEIARKAGKAGKAGGRGRPKAEES